MVDIIINLQNKNISSNSSFKINLINPHSSTDLRNLIKNRLNICLIWPDKKLKQHY